MLLLLDAGLNSTKLNYYQKVFNEAITGDDRDPALMNSFVKHLLFVQNTISMKKMFEKITTWTIFVLLKTYKTI